MRPAAPNTPQTTAQLRQAALTSGDYSHLAGKPKSLTEMQCRILAREHLLASPGDSTAALAARYGYESLEGFRRMLDAPYMRTIAAEVFQDFDRNRQVTFNLLMASGPPAARLIADSVEAGDVDTAKFVINKITPNPGQRIDVDHNHSHEHTVSAEVQHSLAGSLGEVLTLMRDADGTFSADPEQYIRRGLDGLDSTHYTELGDTQPASLSTPSEGNPATQSPVVTPSATGVASGSEGATPDSAQPNDCPLPPAFGPGGADDPSRR